MTAIHMEIGRKGHVSTPLFQRWRSAPHMGRTLAEESRYRSFSPDLRRASEGKSHGTARLATSLGALETKSLRQLVHDLALSAVRDFLPMASRSALDVTRWKVRKN